MAPIASWELTLGRLAIDDIAIEIQGPVGVRMMHAETKHEDVREASDCIEDPQLALATEAFLVELEAGGQPSISAYIARYPSIADRLRNCLENLECLHALAPQISSGTCPTLVDSPNSSSAPLGDFQILREIGRGGMGIVYEAKQLSLGRNVALKILPFACVLDSRRLKRFKCEAQAAALLHHPNIVPVFGVGAERSVHYYAMQLIDGVTLADLIHEMKNRGSKAAHGWSFQPNKAQEKLIRKQSSIPPTVSTSTFRHHEAVPVDLAEAARVEKPAHDNAMESTVPSMHGAISTHEGNKSSNYVRSIVELGIQIAEALDHAHSEGVIHRDIKPSNLILDGRGKPWITDFGLAIIESDVGLTMTGDIVGTLRYMSPEQALSGRVAIDHRSDIYSLAATLYELLTLQAVFPGQDRQDLLKQIACHEPRKPRQLNRYIPVELETILLKGLDKDPARRYLTASDLANDLRRLQDHRPILAKPPSALQRAAKWTRRHPSVTFASIALLVLLSLGSLISNARVRRERDARDVALENALANLRLAMSAIDDIYFDPVGGTRQLSSWYHLPQNTSNVRRNSDQALSLNDKKLIMRGLDLYQEIARQNQGDSAARFETAKAHARVGLLFINLVQPERASQHFASALALLEHLVNEQPQDVELRYELACVRYFNARLSNWWPAEHQQFLRVVDDLNLVVEADPANVPARIQLAYALQALTKFDAAIAELNIAAEIRPEDPRIWFAIGAIYDCLQVRSKSEEYIERAIELGEKAGLPEDELALFHELLSWSYVGDNRYEDANRVRSAVADLTSSAEERLSMLCQINYVNREYESMLEKCNRELDAGRESFSVYRYFALAYERLEQRDLALENAYRVLEVAKSDWELIVAGQILGRLGVADLALHAFKLSQQENPNNHFAYIRVAQQLENRGEFAAAITEYSKALTLQPAFSESMAGLIHCLKQTDELAKAIPYLDRAWEASQQDWIKEYRAEVLANLP